MKKIERGKNGRKHAAGFVRRKRTARKKLAEILVGEFGDHVEARRAVNDATTPIKNAEKTGMRERRGSAPVFELRFRGCGIFGDEFDGRVEIGVAWTSRRRGSEEHGGVGRNAEKFAKRETAVGDLIDQVLCSSWHHAPPYRARGCGRREYSAKQKSAPRAKESVRGQAGEAC